jgi:hypothetical protein
VNSEERIINGKSALLKAVLSGCRLVELIKVGEKILSHPIALSTTDHVVWYASEDMPANTIAPQTGTAIIDIYDYNIMGNFLKSDNPLLPLPGDRFEDGYYFSFSAISYRGALGGYSCMVGKKPFLDGDHELHRAFCSILASEMNKQEALEKVYLLSKEEILLMSLLDNPNHVEDVLVWKKLIKANPGYSQLVVIRPKKMSEAIPFNISTFYKLRNLLGCDLCFPYNGELVALTAHGAFSEENTLLCETLSLQGIVAGLSFPFKGLDGLKQRYRQAASAASYCCEFDRPITSYAEFVFRDIAREYLKSNDAGILCNLDIPRLVAYDAEHLTRLTPTLEAFLECGHNIKKTAKKLNVHRNTALARMDRIKRLASDIGVMAMDGLLSLILFDEAERKQIRVFEEPSSKSGLSNPNS